MIDFYPGASEIIEPNKDLAGLFLEGEPSGITLHYSAARNLSATLGALAANKLKYHIIITREGSIVQIARLDHRVNHAGKASWHGKSPNRSHWAVCILSWGMLDDLGRTWTGIPLSPKEIQYQGNTYWDSATIEQEASLNLFLRWAVSSYGIPASGVCGHDECCIPFGRKKDPGGIFSFSLPALRGSLAQLKKPEA